MQHLACDVVFFDIGETLASVTLASDGVTVDQFRVFPYVPSILQHLSECQGLRIGVISDPGPVPQEQILKSLQRSGLLAWIDRSLIVFGSKQTSTIFRSAAARAVTPRCRCLFVGEDVRERQCAIEAGLLVAPHPALASDVARGHQLSFVRIRVPRGDRESDWWEALQNESVVPLHVCRQGPEPELLAIVSEPTALRLGAMRFHVDHLRGDPATTDAYLLRDDRRDASGDLQPHSASKSVFTQDDTSRILAHCGDGTIVALKSSESVEQYHFAEARHGHTVKLIPDTGLLRPFGTFAGGQLAGFVTALASVAPRALSDDDRRIVNDLDSVAVSGRLDRYLVASRHIDHPGNRTAVDILAGDLEGIGEGWFRVSRSRFHYQGRTLHNVEAELPGTSDDPDVRNSVIVVSAHLDSTAAFDDDPYDSSRDDAPGADDDGSGVAAVLAIAQVIRAAHANRPLARTVRFVLFNAEEQGLVGSKSYARAERMSDAPIIAVYQMDMIGYRGSNVAPYPFEIHHGAPGMQDVEERSQALAVRLREFVPQVADGVLAHMPQFYGADDPAAGRSDHASFQQQGYAACVVTEDFFIGPLPSSPAPQNNPHYHKGTDTRDRLDFDYLAAIARVVAAAALTTARE